MEGREGGQTVRRMFLHYFHDSDDGGNLAAGMVEKCQIAFFHGAEVVPCCSSVSLKQPPSAQSTVCSYLSMPECLLMVRNLKKE